MSIHIFGSSTCTGQELITLLKDRNNYDFFDYSRSKKGNCYLDLNYPDTFQPLPSTNQTIWFSFTPIWVFASFLKSLDDNNSEKLENVSVLIACSSSSAITKKYSFNSFDQALVHKLTYSEHIVSEICDKYKIKYSIIRPSMVYGCISNFKDKNIEKIKNFIRFSPFIVLPTHTGLRQPIHSSQLADVAYNLSQNFLSSKVINTNNKILYVGGDYEISYESMILLIQKSLPKNDLGRFFMIIKVPNIIFIILIFPIVLVSTKYYEALLRIFVDLSGFKKSFQITGKSRRHFPINNDSIYN